METTSTSTSGEAPGKVIKTVMISLNIVRKGNKFLCTNETDGWYIPAGRVDLGEVFPTAGKRECLEEGGVPIRLDSVLRIEHTPAPDFVRMRVFFLASPIDDTPPRGPESADDEIIEAQWLTLDEISKKKPLRSSEILHVFKWVESLDKNGATSASMGLPVSVFTGVDAAEVHNTKVVAKIRYGVKVVIFNPSSDKILVHQKNGSKDFEIVEYWMERSSLFSKAAQNILTTISDKISVVLTLKGWTHIHHVPPPNGPSSTGSVQAYYAAQFATEDDVSNVDKLLPSDYQWIDVKSLSSVEFVPAEEKHYVSHVASGSFILQHPNKITVEHAPYQ